MSSLRDQALTALHHGDPADACYLFLRAVEAVPHDSAAWGGLGVAYCRLSRPAEGLAALEYALRLGPEQAGLHHNRGRALEMLRRPAEAVAAYRRALQLEPGHEGSAAAAARLSAGTNAPPPQWAPQTPVYGAPQPAYAAIPYSPGQAPDSGRQAAIVVSCVLLGLVVLVGGIAYSWWRLTQQFARLARPPATRVPSYSPPAFAERPNRSPGSILRTPRESRFPQFREWERPEIHIPDPPEIRIPEPPQIRIPEPPEIRIPEPPPVYIPPIPDPPEIRIPARPRFERPEIPSFPSRRPFPGAPFDGNPNGIPGADRPPFPRPSFPRLTPPEFPRSRFGPPGTQETAPDKPASPSSDI